MDLKIICKIHQLPSLCFDKQAVSDKKFLCFKCILARLQVESIGDLCSSQLKIQNQIELQAQSTVKLLQDLLESAEFYKQQTQQIIERLLQNISQLIKSITQKLNILKGHFHNFNQNTFEEIIAEQSNFKHIISEGQNQLNNDLNALSDISKTDEIFNILKNFNPKMDIEESEINKVKLEQLDKSYSDNVSTQSSFIIEKKFDYQVIQQLSYKEIQYCRAIAFNKDNTLMIADYDKMIKVFEFKDDKLKEIQQLNGHTGNVHCLLFMKKSNQFISGSSHCSIIWEQQNQNNQWQSIQVLKAHTLCIWTITINKNEDMLISGSADSTIKFWQRENNTWNSKQSIQCSNIVYSVSLSNNEDKLIASISDKQILVIQLQGKEWIINQKISVEQYGWRLCFINQNQFVFQPYDKQYLLIYDYDQKEQKYKQGAEVKYQNKGSDGNALFPIQYIQQMGLILVKNDEYVHLIKRVQNGQYTVEQSIHFGTSNLFGCISDDGRYIATWDSKSMKIQIRQLS